MYELGKIDSGDSLDELDYGEGEQESDEVGPLDPAGYLAGWDGAATGEGVEQLRGSIKDLGRQKCSARR
jgi:hypothetical protein